MFTHSFCGAIQGIDAHVIHVEVDVCDGLPMFSLVGLLSFRDKRGQRSRSHFLAKFWI